MSSFTPAEILQKFSPANPALIVPITGTNIEEVVTQSGFVPAAADMVEWRVDKLEKYADLEAVREAGVQIRRLIDKPILATLRSHVEGGNAKLSSADYLAVTETLCASGCSDMIDLEITDDDNFEAFKIAKKYGVLTVFSKHFYDPETVKQLQDTHIYQLLDTAFERGADVAKVAIWTDNARSLLKILEITFEYHEEYPDRPIIIIGMGDYGQASRLIGGLFGSCATFASLPLDRNLDEVSLSDGEGVDVDPKEFVNKMADSDTSDDGRYEHCASAPGQLPARITREILDLLH